MGLEALGAIEARIASIQQTVAQVSSVPVTSTGTSGTTDFAALLAQAQSSSALGGATGTQGLDASSLASALGSAPSLGATGAGAYDPTSMLQALGAGNGGSAASSLASLLGGAAGNATSTNPFVREAQREIGKRYVFGAEASTTNANPASFDCSELVQWAAGRNGVELPDGSWQQYLQAKHRGQLVPVEQALQTPGALLFSFSSEPTDGGGRPTKAHVAISLGDGRTIEARGRSYGVGEWGAGNRFQYAAVVPGLS